MKYRQRSFKRITSQSTIEYILLLAIVIIVLVVGNNFLKRIRGGLLDKHFITAAEWIGGVNLAPSGIDYNDTYNNTSSP